MLSLPDVCDHVERSGSQLGAVCMLIYTRRCADYDQHLHTYREFARRKAQRGHNYGSGFCWTPCLPEVKSWCHTPVPCASSRKVYHDDVKSCQRYSSQFEKGYFSLNGHPVQELLGRDHGDEDQAGPQFFFASSRAVRL
jgi:hypothetical protein